MERTPRSGELYRHFKNKLYQIVTIAEHSETGEKLVIYQALYGTYQVYARPLEMFVSEVDHEKYPEVSQRYRFEKVEPEQAPASTAAGKEKEEVPPSGTDTGEKMSGERKPVEGTAGRENGEVQVHPKLMDFLDTEDLEEKYNILMSMRDCVDDRMINNMAVALDVVIPEGDITERYEQLKHCIRTKQRYESDRVRF